MSGPPSPP
ncbi:RNA binding (RRM/RBD/RNP motifs) family protein [Zea mays]|uniref:RNA binding (RRM/RBD/RNP motifs) family protein n=1 Tax=Zea mays TaxID=4577 RepID=A0A1D6J1C6_MAIZE|nr:RNA binding (RRM/RBD/RNP motifs) family protein [Zea mays]AQK41838.1 RNA binding (RRM/RBD/RNP motifs) family protein [Zea mays]AQK41839.1 RNA binding (RRM/RBD/RNP motifs) family protein [Zea mays]AQK41840.1 RNA binding (RRM/RBD/RNP motifs) family protein [Zea mays]AQK41841.1 RNA binding (RRM/RBD/RNP motifs) family protein [Zea mays]